MNVAVSRNDEVGFIPHSRSLRKSVSVLSVVPATTEGATDEGAIVAMDKALIAGVLRNDPDAWRRLVETYGPLIRSRVAHAARKFDRSHDAAGIDDVTAEIFASLVAQDAAAIRAFAGRRQLGTYLSVIATRVAIRHWARLLRSENQTSSINPANEQYQPSSGETRVDGIDRLIRDEDRTRLRRLVERLPNRQRELIDLFYVKGLSYTEIQTKIGVPIGSIGPTLRRAETKLRRWIEDAS